MHLQQLLPVMAVVLLQAGCSRQNVGGPQSPRQDTPVSFMRPVQPIIYETSGMVDSKKNKDHLWVLEDSGNPPQLVLLGHTGSWTQRTFIKGATNRDWEAMALAKDTLYIGDIGDNAQVLGQYFVYRLPEPAAGTDTAEAVQKITFNYPDGAHDAEALFVDEAGNIFIITKRNAVSGIYKLSPPFGTAPITALKVGTLNYNGVVDAALSADGKMILVKTYSAVNQYSRSTGEAIATALQRQPATLPYTREPQGETVALRTDSRGYFTLSEAVGNAAPQLYFYALK